MVKVIKGSSLSQEFCINSCWGLHSKGSFNLALQIQRKRDKHEMQCLKYVLLFGFRKQNKPNPNHADPKFCPREMLQSGLNDTSDT